jgi:hypothetical protein
VSINGIQMYALIQVHNSSLFTFFYTPGDDLMRFYRCHNRNEAQLTHWQPINIGVDAPAVGEKRVD